MTGRTRILISAILFWLLTFASKALAGYDFAIDLDRTLVTYIAPGSEFLYPRDRIVTITFSVDGYPLTQQYCLLPNARAFLTALAKEPDSSINIVSGGSRVRNEALLKAIRIGDKSLWSMTRRLLSEEDLVPSGGVSVFDSAPGHPGLPRKDGMPAKSWKKALKKINHDLGRVILFDDEPAWVDSGEESHLIAVVDRDARGIPGPFEHAQMNVWQGLKSERLRLALGLFDLARKNAQMSGRPIDQELFALQWERKPGGTFVPRSLDRAELRRRGSRLLGADLPGGFYLNCSAWFSRLMGV